MLNFAKLSKKQQILVFLSIFIISRIIFYTVGVRFDHTTIYGFGQILDVFLLKTRLAESLFYLHSQPPLFNGFIGIVLKIFPGYEQAGFAAFYLVMGFGFYLILFKLMKELGVRESISFYVSTIFIISPSAIIYENWLFYTYPVAFFYTATTLALVLFLKNNNLLYSFLLFSLLVVMTLLRQTFHPVYMFIIAIVLFFCYKNLRKSLVLGSLIPLIVISAFLIKNLVLFGTLTSSWLGMNFANITIKYMPDEKKEALVKEGKLDKISSINSFANLKYYDSIVKPHTPFGIPVLDISETTTNNLNFNNYDYILISKLYYNESLKALRYAPGNYLKNVAASFYLYFRSPTDYRYFFNSNREKIDIYDRVFNCVVYLQTGVYTPLTKEEKMDIKFSGFRPILLKYTGVLSIILYPLLIILSFIYLKRYSKVLPGSTKFVIIYIALIILLATFMGNLLEVAENNRFRFEIEPLFYVLFGFCFEIFVNNRRKLLPPKRNLQTE